MNNMTTDALKLYHDIDTAIENHFKVRKKQPPCSNGCASCCSQFFEISELEFELIFEMIDKWTDSDKKELFKRAEILFETFKEHWPNFARNYFSPDTITLNTDDYYNDPERFEVSIPCVFLSPEGSCTVYDRRPNICRTTGVGFQHLINKGAVCNYIKLGITTPLWQADLRPFRESIEELRWLEDPTDPEKYKRQYPMFYYVHTMI
jgi:Fe-S-cluster containining protein